MEIEKKKGVAYIVDGQIILMSDITNEEEIAWFDELVMKAKSIEVAPEEVIINELIRRRHVTEKEYY